MSFNLGKVNEAPLLPKPDTADKAGLSLRQVLSKTLREISYRLNRPDIVDCFACSDDNTTAITVATVLHDRFVYPTTLTNVRASLSTAQTSGSIFTIDIQVSGVSILSTLLTIDNTEKTSYTASTPAVLIRTSFNDDEEITILVTQVGDGTAKGLKVRLIGRET